MVGCSSAGEIVSDLLYDDGLAVAVCRFDSTRLVVVSQPIADAASSYAVGQTVGARLLVAQPDLAAVFVLSDGLFVNGSTLVSGLTDRVGPAVAVSGGLAADGPRFVQTWVLVEGLPRSGYVVALGLAGDNLRVGHGSEGGWDILGPERRVTRSVGNVLYELDGQPALALYKRYLGERAAQLPAAALLFPLSVRATRGDEHPVLRTILAVDEAAQSMTFAGDVPQGCLVRLMRATFDRLIDGAQSAAQACAPTSGPTLAVAVSCVGRRLVLGRRTEDELAATVAGLPEGSAMVGYYSYGEISPRPDRVCEFLNQTMTITTFQEAS